MAVCSMLICFLCSELKLEIYRTIISWMNVSKNSVAGDKVVSSWAQQIRKDVQIERDSIELNLSTRSKGSKKGSFKASNKTQFISTSLNPSGSPNIKFKNSSVCAKALEVLSLVIPSLDPASHKVLDHY